MNGFLKVFPMVLVCGILIGLTGCASTQETTDDGTMNPDATPSKDDTSHGWGDPNFNSMQK
jgi:hypothetical protein